MNKTMRERVKKLLVDHERSGGGYEDGPFCPECGQYSGHDDGCEWAALMLEFGLQPTKSEPSTSRESELGSHMRKMYASSIIDMMNPSYVLRLMIPSKDSE